MLTIMLIIKRLPEFDEGFDGLRDRSTSIPFAVRLDKLQRGILGDVKPVGEGVFDMREFFGPAGGCITYSTAMC